MVTGPVGAAADGQGGLLAPAGSRGPAAGDLTEVCHQACEHIRATDDTSLKLLAAVPLAAGTGLTLLPRPSAPGLAGGARSLLSLSAAVVTFAICRWERKNIAACARYRDRAAALERDHFQLPAPAGDSPAPGTCPHGRLTAPALAGRPGGKAQAEIPPYRTVIVSWLTASACTLIR